MPRELITVSVGQCGNQIGWRFWDMVLREHAALSKDGTFEESMSSFFRNVDERYADPKDVPATVDPATGASAAPLASLRARAVLIDSEEGVVSQVLRGSLQELFDRSQVVTDVSGAGNNWAHGFYEYGPRHREAVLEAVRHAIEPCDSPQSFFLLHSLGGGTGSGLGTYVLEALADEHPEIHRVCASVFPASEDDDVITSPYNAALATSKLVEHADCVLPVENEALLRMVRRVERHTARATPGRRLGADGAAGGGAAGGGGDAAGGQTAFDSMNSIAAQLLTNMTAGMRFQGSLNVDLNEIATNLVPFPSLQFILPSAAPLMAPVGRRGRMAAVHARTMDQLFSDVFAPEHGLVCADLRASTFLACGFLARGDVCISDVQRNIDRLSSRMRLAWWNTDGFKTGLCDVAPLDAPRSLLCLSNNCAAAGLFGRMYESFRKLYCVRAHLHHYSSLLPEATTPESVFGQAGETLQWLSEEYRRLDGSYEVPDVARDPDELVGAVIRGEL